MVNNDSDHISNPNKSFKNASGESYKRESVDQSGLPHSKQNSWQDKGFRNKKEGPREFIKKNINFEKYSKEQKKQTITYVLLIVGVITFFFRHALGEFIVGGVAGYHFSSEIIYYMRNLSMLKFCENKTHCASLAAILLLLLFSSFSIFLGALICASLRNAISNHDVS